MAKKPVVAETKKQEKKIAEEIMDEIDKLIEEGDRIRGDVVEKKTDRGEKISKKKGKGKKRSGKKKGK